MSSLFSKSRAVAAWLLAALLTAAYPALAADVPQTREQGSRSPWVEVASAPFLLQSDLGPERTLQLATDLLSFARRLDRSLGGPSSSRPRARIVVSSTRADRAVLRRIGFGNRASGQQTGLFLPHPENPLIVVDGRAPGQLETTLRHEFFHHAAHHLYEHLPPWLNEGLAEVVAHSGGRLGDDEGTFAEEHGTALRATPILPLSDLIRTPEQLQRQDPRLFYALSYLATKHLLSLGQPDDFIARLSCYRRTLRSSRCDPFSELLARPSTRSQLRALIHRTRYAVPRVARQSSAKTPEVGGVSLQPRTVDEVQIARSLAPLLDHRASRPSTWPPRVPPLLRSPHSRGPNP